MTGPLISPDELGSPGRWLEDVAASLAAAGTPGQLSGAEDEKYLAIPAALPGHRAAEVIVDSDGYCELRWWLTAGTPARQAAAVITAALHAAHAPVERQ